MIYDLIIVGAGSAGISAAIYAGRAMLKTLVIEKSSYGGRIKDTSEIVNYPGFKRISGMELISNFKEQAINYPTNDFIYGTVNKIVKEDNGNFTVSTRRKGDFSAKAVIVALGTKAKILGINGESEFTGKGVSYCSTCDANLFAGKDIHILGSGDVALEEADYLSKFVNKITMIVIHEEGIVDGNEVEKQRVMNNPKIEFLWNTSLEEIKGDGFVKELIVKNLATGEKKRISSEGIFMFVGLVPQTDIVKGLAELNDNGFIIVDEKKETNVEGLFAAGDCTETYLRQVITAASDGAVAAVAAERYIRGRI